ncbi:MAG: hypothetical protein IJW77_04725 [Clostridia bacterium]|nr:hypothetical protein [Clostridia bacterium]
MWNEYPRTEERTGVQESRDFAPTFDVQSDFVMVYGLYRLKERIAPWKKRGYVIHLMTGVSWGGYQDYLFGKYDGINHRDEGQVYADGSERVHGPDVPYMVPTNAFAHYLSDGLKKAIDAGVEAIHLEEPEFWAESGYSPAFKREWEIFYREPWCDPQGSADAQYRASKLKQYLYTRTLDRLCSECKEYAMKKYGRLLRFYVPTHSLINYSQWMIVSPESALLDVPTIDGYIAQIWTGTSRQVNTYRGVEKERTFETGFLEYGIMQELVRGTDRRMWFLADPIEDNPQFDWDDYRDNYYRTVTASLLHPKISDYEVSPWPGRVMRDTHPRAKDDPTQVKIPPEYKTNLLSVMHTLRQMADQGDGAWLMNTAEVGVCIADSAMFQRIYPNNTEPAHAAHFNAFYGLALPLVKCGLSARPVQLDNVRRFPAYLDAYKVLVLSYEFIKPASPDINVAIAGWVQAGGTLVYVGDGSDAFHEAHDWWNTAADYKTPAEHLMESLGLGRCPAAGRYTVGGGTVTVIDRYPGDVAYDAALSDDYRDTVLTLLAERGIDVTPTSTLKLRRGCYIVTAAMDESIDGEQTLDGTYVNLYDTALSVVKNPTLICGTVGLWYDLSRIDKSGCSDILALSGRAEKLTRTRRMLSFVFRGPADMTAAARIWTKRPPQVITADGNEIPFVCDAETGTTYFDFPSNGEPIQIKVKF